MDILNKNEIIEFFNACAPSWDDGMIRYDDVIDTILEQAEVKAGDRILDVACGTGVLFPDYRKRAVASVTGIDISPEMVRIAESKYAWENYRILCGDVEALPDVEACRYDRVMVYNAFPHFPDPGRLIARLSLLVVPGGTLTVAHGMSREQINRHHSGTAGPVSVPLMPAENLAELFASAGLEITVRCSNERMYQVTGRKP